jgi:ribonucleoside-diphosphate reductase alpha chain
MPEMIPAPPFDSAALELLHSRYLGKDPEGQVIETPEGMFRRVARHIAAVEARYGGDSGEWATRFEHAMSALEFLPNSPTLMNAGTPVGQLAACFVLPVDDHLEGIFATMRDAALVHRTGGGVGLDFSRLRPAGDPLASTGGVSSGPVSFMRVFDAASEAVRSGGRRRAANMGVMDVHHPDIEAFITAKRDEPGLRTFNLSVACDDAFMKAAAVDDDIALVNPRTGKTVAARSAARLSDLIVECAWATGDPGLLFLDRINQDNPTPALGRITATNPCGEVPLLPNEACFLGSINLARLTRAHQLDWVRLGELVDLAVRFLDDGIDASHFPIPAIGRAVVATRKIGVGLMGFADCLVDLGVAYDSIRGSGTRGRDHEGRGRACNQRIAAACARARSVSGLREEPGRGGAPAGHPERHAYGNCADRQPGAPGGMFALDRAVLRPRLQQADARRAHGARAQPTARARGRSDRRLECGAAAARGCDGNGS